MASVECVVLAGDETVVFPMAALVVVALGVANGPGIAVVEALFSLAGAVDCE